MSQRKKMYTDAIKILSQKISGYTGYEIQPKRATTDKLIREFLVEGLGKILDRVKATQEAAIFSQLLMLWSDLENLHNSFHTAFSAVQNTDYEQSTFYIAKNIEGLDVGMLTLADLSIVNIFDKLDPKIDTFSQAIESGMYQDASSIVMDVLMDGASIHKTWMERVRLIRNYRRMVVE